MRVRNIILGIIVYLIFDNLIPVDPKKISSCNAKAKIQNLTYDHIIDIRPSAKRDYGYHAYSISIPFNEIKNIKDKVKRKNRKLLIISNTELESRKAANIISSYGYRNVEYLNGSWINLIKKN